MPTEQPPHPIQLAFEALGLSPEMLRLVIQEWSATTGAKITFEQGSNPQFHFHIVGGVMAKKDESSTHYTDQSTGPTGAKAFGPESTATSHGSVVQNQALEPLHSTELVEAFGRLAVILSEIQLANREALDEALKSLERAKQETSSAAPQKSLISSAWQKAKSWVDAALSVGTFAVAKAEEIRSLVAKITGLLS